MSDQDDQIQRLQEACEALQQEVRALRRQAAQAPRPSGPLSRRRLLLGAGAAAGAAVGLLRSPAAPALATDGLALVAGQSNTDTSTTAIAGSVLSGPALRASNYFGGSFDNYSDAFQAYTYGAGLAAAYGRNDAAGGTGVYGYSSSGVGGTFSGGLAPLRLQPAATAGPPTSFNHQQGELYVDTNGAVWVCTQSGSPSTVGTFAQLSTGAGSSVFLTTPPPAAATWSWVNQGNATVADGPGAMILTLPSETGGNAHLLDRALPATPFDVQAAVALVCDGEAYPLGGLCVRDSGSGKITALFVLWDSSRWQVKLENWNSPSSSAGTVREAGALLPGPCYLRITDDGTTRKYYIGATGRSWSLLSSESHAGFCTPNRVGICGNSNGYPQPWQVELLSWSGA